MGGVSGMRLKYNKEIFDSDELPNIEIDKKLKTFIARDKDKIYVNVAGENFVFTALEDDDFSGDGGNSESEDRAEISAPMPGQVIKVNVSEGDSVEEGDSLLVVEAMKMETKLYSPISGIIKEVNAKPDQQVSPDDVLIVVEKIDS
jgi:biotin carboxyl carrier protein